jgi:hypothetical protein
MAWQGKTYFGELALGAFACISKRFRTRALGTLTEMWCAEHRNQ